VFLPNVLAHCCGLDVVPGVPIHRLSTEVGEEEWDFRAAVRVAHEIPPAAGTTDRFVIYPHQAVFITPPPPRILRYLTPTKFGAVAPPLCHYIAIFETTTMYPWTKKLLPRLEARLRLSVERARIHNDAFGPDDVLQVVGVVGVVSPKDSRDSVTHKVNTKAFPLLRMMMNVGRFVWFKQDFD
jgi:hypothetical protein